MSKDNAFSRRGFLGRLAAAGGGALAASGILGIPFGRLFAQGVAPRLTGPHRFLSLFLNGGWCAELGTIPVRGSRATSGTYEPIYQDLPMAEVPGKSQLWVGAGLEPATSAFATLPTAFVNGMLVEITAHDVAYNYLQTGRLSTSRSREYPSMAALMGAAGGTFPPHLVLGYRSPLGDTKNTTPPLHATTYLGLQDMLYGPRGSYVPVQDPTIDAAHALTAALNELHLSRLSEGGQATLAPWVEGEKQLGGLYQKRYDTVVKMDDAMRMRYGVLQNPDLIEQPFNSDNEVLGAAYLSLKSGLCPYVTVAMGQYDTHGAHLAGHVDQMRGFAFGLTALVNDLMTTPDPDDPGLMLGETTTILITSEFTRTPLFNVAAGTDHWPSASAILMGKGVKDNTVVGSTRDDAYPQGWDGVAGVVIEGETLYKPDHLVATVLRLFGRNEEANLVSEVTLDVLA